MNFNFLVDILFIISVLVFIYTLYIIIPKTRLKKKMIPGPSSDQKLRDQLLKKKE
ncbi:hypothetical protein FB2170_04560 [Maribacter sp. HTCC2170]|nr:hypothetical protein FB2170_04560 [Maribacter sp. HTCC2170]